MKVQILSCSHMNAVNKTTVGSILIDKLEVKPVFDSVMSVENEEVVGRMECAEG